MTFNDMNQLSTLVIPCCWHLDPDRQNSSMSAPPFDSGFISGSEDSLSQQELVLATVSRTPVLAGGSIFSFNVESVYDEDEGVEIISCWLTHWRTLGGSRLSSLSIPASPAMLSARLLPLTPACSGLKIQVRPSRLLLDFLQCAYWITALLCWLYFR